MCSLFVPPGQPAPEGVLQLFIDHCGAVPIGRLAEVRAEWSWARRSCAEVHGRRSAGRERSCADVLVERSRMVRQQVALVKRRCLFGRVDYTVYVLRMLPSCRDRRLMRGVVRAAFQGAAVRWQICDEIGGFCECVLNVCSKVWVRGTARVVEFVSSAHSRVLQDPDPTVVGTIIQAQYIYRRAQPNLRREPHTHMHRQHHVVSPRSPAQPTAPFPTSLILSLVNTS